MSTLKTVNVVHPSSSTNNIVTDANGNVAVGGTVSMASSFLRNRVINGAMEIDQRNAGAAVTINSAADTYTLDRWLGAGQSADGVFTIQQDSSAPTGFSNSLKATVTTADTSLSGAQSYQIQQKIEGFNFSDCAFGTANAKTITLSFWTRSSLTGTFGGSLVNSAFNRSYPFTFTISAVNTWEYKTITIPGDTSGTWVGATNGIGSRVYFGLGAADRAGPAGTWASAGYVTATGAVSIIGTLNATFYLTGVQLEVGTVATPFERRLYTTELQLAQRYYASQRVSLGTAYNGDGNIVGKSTYVGFKTTMRAAPTLSFTNVSTSNVSAEFGDFITADGFAYYVTVSATGNYYRSSTVTISSEL